MRKQTNGVQIELCVPVAALAVRMEDSSDEDVVAMFVGSPVKSRLFVKAEILDSGE